jgi:glycosyltransferase involved in cell wall biosynthesis
MRYLWDQYEAYFGEGAAAARLRLLARPLLRRLRRWDVETCDRVDAFVANSENVRARIARPYRRDATVVYPPVDVCRFKPAAKREEFYLLVTALVPYKRVDAAVAAFNRLGKRLVVVGDGPELPSLQNRADANILFRGWLEDAEVADLMGRCRAFVLPGEEDFGIAAVEAQAAGAPVIALGRGGALETVVPHEGGEAPGNATGVLYDESSVDALVHAVERFEALKFDGAALRRNAERFAPEHFRDGMRAQLARVLEA